MNIRADWPAKVARPVQATWNMLPLVLSLAFLVRAVLALNTDAVAHPDAIFQYLEQGHRLAFGNGIIPWEYAYGIRSWIIPGFIALILEGLAAIGLDSPLVYQPVVKLTFCFISLTLPLSVYRITQSLLDETAARVALLTTSFWYEIVYYAHTPLPDALATYTLFGALACVLRPPIRSRVLAFGALAGLTLALRYQLVPAVAAACVIAAVSWRWKALPALAALAFVLFLSGALDAYTWGIWFSSIVSNLELNLFRDVASGFSKAPPYYYLAALATTSVGLAYVGCFGLALTWRRTWPVSAVGLVTLLAFSMVAHKEPRFIFVVVPIYWIGIAALAANDRTWSAARLSFAVRTVRGVLAPYAVIVAIGSSIVGMIHRMQPDDSKNAYLMLSDRADVQGVIDDTKRKWEKSGGYYYLHKNVPIYRRDMPATNIAAVLESPARFATHWITESESPPSSDYALLARMGEVSIWQRSGGPTNVEIAQGYSTRAPMPFESFSRIAPSPAVKARW